MREQGVTLEHNLIVASTVGEETGGLGADAFREWLGKKGIVIDELVVSEPTQCIPIYGCVFRPFFLRGCARLYAWVSVSLFVLFVFVACGRVCNLWPHPACYRLLMQAQRHQPHPSGPRRPRGTLQPATSWP